MLLDQNGYHDVPPGKLAAVVTYLEMTAPPERPPAPERPDLGLAPLPRHDLAGYRDLFRSVGADWLWFSRLLMPDEQLRAILEDSAVEAYALQQDGRAIGLGDRLSFQDMQGRELAFIRQKLLSSIRLV